MVISLEEQRTIGPNEARRIGRSLLGGRFLERGTERVHRAPFDAALDGPILDAGEVDVATAVTTAVAGAKVAGALPVHSRVAIVERLAGLVDRDAERLAATMTWQTGKPIRETRREVVRAADTLRLSARAADLLAGEQISTDTTPGGRPLWAFSHRRPMGVVAAITPFNAPLNLLAHKLGPSIIGGNATIVKPASAAPLTAVQLVELAIEAGCPPDSVNVLVGPAALGLSLVSHPDVRAITFTGGARAAREIWAGAPLKRLVMELGGNSANILFDDADLELAAGECVRGSFSNSGQSCNSVQRIIAPTARASELADLMTAQIADLKVGDPFDNETDIGSMVSETETARVCEWLDEAVAEGAFIRTGGTRTGATLIADSRDRRSARGCGWSTTRSSDPSRSSSNIPATTTPSGWRTRHRSGCSSACSPVPLTVHSGRSLSSRAGPSSSTDPRTIGLTPSCMEGSSNRVSGARTRARRSES